MKPVRASDIIKLIFSIGICLYAGYAGSTFTASEVDTWYRLLDKPSFTPPDWVFAPVWTILYVLMGVSLFLVWRQGINDESRKAVMAFSAQLAINVSWSIVFFGLKSLSGGLIVISMLWIAIIITMIQFNRTSKLAAIILAPYLAWVSYAAMLNVSIVILNS